MNDYDLMPFAVAKSVLMDNTQQGSEPGKKLERKSNTQQLSETESARQNKIGTDYLEVQSINSTLTTLYSYTILIHYLRWR
jgi:hypothetical protein